ncbi:MAG: serine/threonine-protein kinase [Kofleriaceae bacterium]
MSGEETACEEFGPYVVAEMLGSGDMCSVHRAQRRTSAGLERSVALKRLLPHLTADPTLADNLLREVRAVSHLIHPNIRQVYECGRVGRDAYLSLEYVEGNDVRRLLRYARRSGEAIPLSVVLSLLADLCQAFDHAHTFGDEQGDYRGVLHLDLSPSNLLVSNTGHLKVLDFGVAAALDAQTRRGGAKVPRKVGYLAPEVTLRKSCSPASDVFSIGVIAYELITTRPLFWSKTEDETRLRVLHAEVTPPSRINLACPAQLDRIVLAALCREPCDRLQSAADLHVEVERVAARFGIRLSSREVFDWLSGVSSESWSSLTPLKSLSQQQAAASASQLRPLPLPPPPELEPEVPRARRPRSTSITEAAALADQGHALGLGASLTPLPRVAEDDVVEIAWGSPTTTGSGVRPPSLVKSVGPSRRHRHVTFAAIAMVLLLGLAGGLAMVLAHAPPAPPASSEHGH